MNAATGVAVVVPVHDHATLLDGLLASLAPEVAAVGAEVVVVDDGSTDDSGAVAARHGATVVRLGTSGGPYVARNVGWRRTTADVVAFTDARCRARPGWLAGLVDALSTDPGLAVVGGDTHTLPGAGPAARFAHHRQALLAAPALAHQFLPYLPTCNVATRRDVLESLDGFTEVRSGGDVDLSWRAQLAGLGGVARAAGADMDWVPRRTLSALVRQYRRYGDAWPRTAARFLEHGFRPHVPPDIPRWRLAAVHLRRLVREVPGDDGPTLAAIGRLCWFSYWDAYHRSYREVLATGVPLPPPGAS